MNLTDKLTYTDWQFLHSPTIFSLLFTITYRDCNIHSSISRHVSRQIDIYWLWQFLHTPTILSLLFTITSRESNIHSFYFQTRFHYKRLFQLSFQYNPLMSFRRDRRIVVTRHIGKTSTSQTKTSQQYGVAYGISNNVGWAGLCGNRDSFVLLPRRRPRS